jgi:hypothetical protein
MSEFKEVPASKFSISMRKLVQGIGINNANYMTNLKINGKEYRCPFYLAWRGMLRRCYDPIYHRTQPTYIGCTVAVEWHEFINFKAWMTKQDWKNKQLDKDIIIQGNKIYSPLNCVFVSHDINKLLNTNAAKRGGYPLGVTFNKKSGKYQSQCTVNGRKTKYLGLFPTPELAHDAYKKFKYELIANISMLQPEPIKSALLKYVIREIK